MTGLFFARAIGRPARLRRAWRWAAAQRDGFWKRAQLVVPLLAYQGQFIARSALVGVRDLDALRRSMILRGQEHLRDPGPKILLGFHLGPPACDIALWLHGFRPIWVGGRRVSRGWSRLVRLMGVAGDDLLGQTWGPARLYAASQALSRGRLVYIPADGMPGRVTFTVPLPGRDEDLGEGWFALRRRTRVAALPVLAHADGRTVVVTVYPPLPAPHPDRATDIALCRDALAPVLEGYVRHFPEQCLYLAFGAPPVR